MVCKHNRPNGAKRKFTGENPSDNLTVPLPVKLRGFASVLALAIDKVMQERIRMDAFLFVALYIPSQAWLNLISLHPATLQLVRF